MDKKEKNKKVAELIIRMQQNDSNSLTELIELTQDDLIKIAYVYLKDRMLAENAVHDTYLALIKSCKRLKNYNNLQGWLHTIVINKSINILKIRQREIPLREDVFSIISEIKDPSDNYINNMVVRECLSKLEDNERQALLFDSYDFKLREIACEMRLTIKEVRTLLQRAKKKFKSYYETYLK